MTSTSDATTDASGPPAFEPVTRETLSAQIRDRLLERIRSGALAPGERVPSERDLSEQFQVARTSVREAMQGLLSMGVVQRRGNRSFVAEHLPEVSFDPRTDGSEDVRRLFEIRRLLEVPIIGLATQHASDDDRAQIVGIAERFHDDIDLREFRELDRTFYSAIARACGNPLLAEVYGKVRGRLARSAGAVSLLADDADHTDADHTAAGTFVGLAIAQHRALATAIAAGDTVAASREGAVHLAALEQRINDRRT